MSSLSPSYRLSVASRALAAILGGYVLTALMTMAIAVYLPTTRAEASLTATMLSFLIYGCVVLWVFATRTAVRAWLGIVIPSVVLGVLVWLQQPVMS